MTKPTFTLLLFLLLLSCSDEVKKKSFEHAGGCLKTALPYNPTDLEIENLNDVYTVTLTQQILEGLFELNPESLLPEKRLVSDYTVSEDGLIYIFNVRKGVYFHPHALIGENRTVTTEDIKYSFEKGCKPDEDGTGSVLYKSIFEGRVKGAREFFEGAAEEIEGLKVYENRVEFHLIHPDINFINKLCIPSAKITAKELIEAKQSAALIGTGPFVYNGTNLIKDNRVVELTRNKKYYRVDEKGNYLPYLDSLHFIIEPKNLHQLAMFEEGEIHHIEGIPSSRITRMFETNNIDVFGVPPKVLLRRLPLLGTQYYSMNLDVEVLKDRRVRQALNYAIDREKIVNEILNGEAYEHGTRGVIPPYIFRDYDQEFNSEFKYNFDVEKARALLAEAGYPKGEGFPKLSLNFDKGTIHSAIASEFSRQMERNLGIIVNLNGLDYNELKSTIDKGEGDLFRMSWYADYKSPESFLYTFNGFLVPKDRSKPSKVNCSRYVNTDFDKYYEQASLTKDKKERFALFAKAEDILLKDAPFIILWYSEITTMTYSNVRNLNPNELSIYFFDKVYFNELTKEEYLEGKKSN